MMPTGRHLLGYWHVIAVEGPNSIDFDDSFADDQHRPDDSSPPIATAVRLAGTATGTTLYTMSNRQRVPEALASRWSAVARGQSRASASAT